VTAVSEPPRAPTNPAPKLVAAAGLLLAAAAGFVVLAIDGSRAIAGELQGQRTEGIVLFTPLIAVVAAVVLAIAAFRGRAPWAAYVAQTTPGQRQAAADAPLTRTSSTPFLVLGLALAVIWLAGVVAIAIFATSPNFTTVGLAMAIMLLTLLALVWIPLVRFAVRIRAAHRRAGAVGR